MKQSKNEEPTKALGEYIKRMRLRKAFSIRGLAHTAGVDPTWLSRLERGDYLSPDPRHLRRLAEALGIDAIDLYLLIGYEGSKRLPGMRPYLRAKYGLPPQAVELLDAYFELLNEKYGAGRKDDRGARSRG